MEDDPRATRRARAPAPRCARGGPQRDALGAVARALARRLRARARPRAGRRARPARARARGAVGPRWRAARLARCCGPTTSSSSWSSTPSRAGRPWPDGYRISDQGLLNVAFGFRDRREFEAAYRRCEQAGLEPNGAPLRFGAWSVVYVNDADGFSIELLHIEPWYERQMGFRPRSRPRLAPFVGRAASARAGALREGARHRRHGRDRLRALPPARPPTRPTSSCSTAIRPRSTSSRRRSRARVDRRPSRRLHRPRRGRAARRRDRRRAPRHRRRVRRRRPRQSAVDARLRLASGARRLLGQRAVQPRAAVAPRAAHGRAGRGSRDRDRQPRGAARAARTRPRTAAARRRSSTSSSRRGPSSAPRGVTFTTVFPGFVDTEMFRHNAFRHTYSIPAARRGASASTVRRWSASPSSASRRRVREGGIARFVPARIRDRLARQAMHAAETSTLAAMAAIEGVLTAMVTPFDDDGAVDVAARAAPRALPGRERLARARRRRDDRRVADAQRRREARAARGGPGRGRRRGHRDRRHRVQRHAPHRRADPGGGRARPRRGARRDALLQQAQPRGPAGALRGRRRGRGLDPDRALQHPLAHA